MTATRDPRTDASSLAEAPSLLGRITDTAISRRGFLGGTGALVVAFALSPRKAFAAQVQPPVGDDPSGSQVGGWVMVAPTGVITILYGGTEMGQGSATGLTQAVAEELCAKWDDVVVQNAPLGPAWTTGTPWLTGGSSGIRSHIAAMRKAGAQAREMLKAAAADAWGVTDMTDLYCADSQVKRYSTGQVAAYADLAVAAGRKPVPADPPILRTGQYVGQSMPRLDIPSKTNGSARYGIDVRLPGMLYAVVKNAPVLGGTLKSTPSKPSGSLGVVNLGNACAVVASNTWAAIMAAKQLSASWTTPTDAAANSSAAILSTAQSLLDTGAAVVAEGDPAAALAAIGTPDVDQQYFTPYLGHFPMEVPNATVRPTYDTLGALVNLEVWAPTQSATSARAAIAPLVPAGCPITIHTTLAGGGFGRKIETDFVVHAVKTALGMKKPVKTIWPREEDVTHDQYRPMALQRIRIGLDPTSKLIRGFHARIVSPSISYQRGRLPASGLESSAYEAVNIATGVPYVAASPTHAVEYLRHPASVWVGYWRSVGASINGFTVESAIDEAAKAAGMDEYRFRRLQLTNSTDPRAARFLAVLDEAARLGGWDTPVPAGRARGISLTTCFNSIVGQVIEISAPTAGALTVHKVAVAIDCGNVVNPNAVEAQMEGGVVMGLSSAMWGRITFTNGKADQNNFSRVRQLRAREMPAVAVSIIRSGADPTGGVGELAVPGVAPALVSAYAKLTGTRVRSLPMFPAASTMGG
jgi:isoquinoline 1-oxidoreductase beta subunit